MLLCSGFGLFLGLLSLLGLLFGCSLLGRNSLSLISFTYELFSLSLEIRYGLIKGLLLLISVLLRLFKEVLVFLVRFFGSLFEICKTLFKFHNLLIISRSLITEILFRFVTSRFNLRDLSLRCSQLVCSCLMGILHSLLHSCCLLIARLHHCCNLILKSSFHCRNSLGLFDVFSDFIGNQFFQIGLRLQTKSLLFLSLQLGVCCLSLCLKSCSLLHLQRL